jgi:hypothetical protein
MAPAARPAVDPTQSVISAINQWRARELEKIAAVARSAFARFMNDCTARPDG